jgi:hypothetical protein
MAAGIHPFGMPGDIALLLADLGVTKTHARPHDSNDNPFSEAQFKTLKPRPAEVSSDALNLPERRENLRVVGREREGLRPLRSST